MNKVKLIKIAKILNGVFIDRFKYYFIGETSRDIYIDNINENTSIEILLLPLTNLKGTIDPLLEDLRENHKDFIQKIKNGKFYLKLDNEIFQIKFNYVSENSESAVSRYTNNHFKYTCDATWSEYLSITSRFETHECSYYYNPKCDCELKQVSLTNLHEALPIDIYKGIIYASNINFKVIPTIPVSIEYLTEDQIETVSKKLSIKARRDALISILNSRDPKYYFRALGKFRKHLIPQLQEAWGWKQNSKYHDLTLSDHLLDVLNKVIIKNPNASIELRLAALLHDISKYKTYQVNEKGYYNFIKHEIYSAEESTNILKSLNFPSDLISKVYKLIKHHMLIKQQAVKTSEGKFEYSGNKRSIKKFLNKYGEDFLLELSELIDADNMSHAPEYRLDGQVESFITQLEMAAIEVNQLAQTRINSSDILLEFNEMKPGNWIGEVKEYLNEKKIQNPGLTTKELIEDLKDELKDNLLYENLKKPGEFKIFNSEYFIQNTDWKAVPAIYRPITFNRLKFDGKIKLIKNIISSQLSELGIISNAELKFNLAEDKLIIQFKDEKGIWKQLIQ